jgi:hypothetical protein
MNALGTREYAANSSGDLEGNKIDFDLTSKWLDSDKGKIVYSWRHERSW